MGVLTINQLIKNTIESNKYSKKRIAQIAGISDKALLRILNAKDIDFSTLVTLSKAIGFKVRMEFHNDNDSIKFDLNTIADEQSN